MLLTLFAVYAFFKINTLRYVGGVEGREGQLEKPWVSNDLVHFFVIITVTDLGYGRRGLSMTVSPHLLTHLLISV